MALRREDILEIEDGTISSMPVNRAEQVRRDNDVVVTPKVDLYDIDNAILYHLSEVLRFNVVENGVSVVVPVMFADAETWTQIRANGYLRDTNKKVSAPLIMLNRSSVDRDTRMPMLGLNNKTLKRYVYPYKTMENRYDIFGGQLNRTPVKEFFMVNMPEYIRVTYEVVIWTNLIEQLNGIIEGLIRVSDHMWGDTNTFKATLETVVNNIQVSTGEDRIVAGVVNLTVDGRLVEEYQYHEATMQKMFSIKTVKIENEREENDLYLTEPVFNSQPNQLSPEHDEIMRKNMRRDIRYR